MTVDPTQPRAKPARITGLRHVLAAGSYSIGGVRRLWREAAFRHEVLAAIAVIALMLFVRASVLEFVIFAVLLALLIATEALNTAIECIVDQVSPGWAEFARDAKDLGSLAVMCLLVSHGVFLAYVLFG